MKRLAILAGVNCLMVLSLSACRPTAETVVDLRAEEQSLRELIEKVLVAYEKRDSTAMTGMCDDPFMNLGGILRGRENIEKLWEAFLVSLGKTQLNLLEEICLEFVTPDVAVLQTRIEFTNRPPDAKGNPQPRQEYFAANLYVKKDGRWLRKGAFLRPITAALPSEGK